MSFPVFKTWRRTSDLGCETVSLLILQKGYMYVPSAQALPANVILGVEGSLIPR